MRGVAEVAFEEQPAFTREAALPPVVRRDAQRRRSAPHTEPPQAALAREQRQLEEVFTIDPEQVEGVDDNSARAPSVKSDRPVPTRPV
jgi:hypothetical protein